MNIFMVYNIERDEYDHVQAPFASFAVMAACAGDAGITETHDIIARYESMVEWDGDVVHCGDYYHNTQWQNESR